MRRKIAVVGLVFGRHVLDQLRREPLSGAFEVVGICDLNEDLLARTAEETGISAYPSLGELLRIPGLEVVGLFSGPAGRADLIRQCFRAGKDVVTTKPFETDGSAARGVLDEALRTGRRVCANSPGPVPAPDLALIGDWAARYELGRPIAARGETWTTYRERYQGSWYDDPERCPCAPILRLGIYLIHDLVHLLGEVAEVSALDSRIFTGRPTPDNAQLSLRFANGALGNVFSSFCVGDGDRYRDSLVVNFERGTVYRNAGAEDGGARGELAVVAAPQGERRVLERASVATRSGDFLWDAILEALEGPPSNLAGSYRTMVEGTRILERLKERERERLAGGVEMVEATLA